MAIKVFFKWKSKLLNLRFGNLFNFFQYKQNKTATLTYQSESKLIVQRTSVAVRHILFRLNLTAEESASLSIRFLYTESGSLSNWILTDLQCEIPILRDPASVLSKGLQRVYQDEPVCPFGSYKG